MSNFGVQINTNTLPILFYNLDFICFTECLEAYLGLDY